MNLYTKISNRLNRIIEKYPSEIKILVNRLGVKNAPNPNVLVLAFLHDKKGFVDGLYEIKTSSKFDGVLSIEPQSKGFGSPITWEGPSLEPNEYSVGYDGSLKANIANPIWWANRQAARTGNMITSSGRFGGKMVKGPFQMPFSYNPVEEPFVGDKYFKVPLKFHPHKKGNVSTDPDISSDCAFKHAASVGNMSEQLILKKPSLPDPIPSTKKEIFDMMEFAVCELNNTDAKEIIKKADKVGINKKIDQISKENEEVILMPKKSENNSSFKLALMLVIGISLLFLANKIEFK